MRLPLDVHVERIRSVIESETVNGLVVPLLEDGRVYGALTVHRRPKAATFSRRDLEVAELVACMAHLALARRAGEQDLDSRKDILDRAWKRIVEAQRLEAMGRQAATIAIGLQNPIAYIEGHLSYFNEFLGDLSELEGEFDLAGARATLTDMRAAVQRISRGAADLSRLSRGREDVEFTLSNAVDASIRMCESLQSEIVVRVDDVVLRGNMGRFAQALSQLLINAEQAMDGTQTALIRVHTKPVSGNRVQLCIEDNGRGISPEDLARIIEPFYTTRDDEEGLGLGSEYCA